MQKKRLTPLNWGVLCSGLPPSWARLPGAAEALAECACTDGARLWRRKLLAFKEQASAENRRPPYYGSWSKQR